MSAYQRFWRQLGYFFERIAIRCFLESGARITIGGAEADGTPRPERVLER